MAIGRLLPPFLKKMSDTETPRDRSNAPSAIERPTKRKGKGRSESKRAKSPVDDKPKLPFMEPDEFSNVTIKVGGKQFYFADAILAYSSPVLKEQLTSKPDTAGKEGKGGKGKPTAQADKELDFSDKEYNDVCDVLSFLDPRVDYDVKDDDVPRLAPIAHEYQMQSLLKECERSITRSFANKRRKRRVNIDVVLQHLEIADTYKFDALNQMCVEACLTTNNPHINRQITESPRIAEKTKIDILQRKLDKVNRMVSKENSRFDSEKGSSRSQERR